jgi:hypothetical protein
MNKLCRKVYLCSLLLYSLFTNNSKKVNIMMVLFKNDFGMHREVKVGFSWTSFFFGGFPFLFRGMPVHGLVWICLAMITFGVSNLILCFIITKKTAVHYLENGYKPVGSNWDIAASSWSISLP